MPNFPRQKSEASARLLIIALASLSITATGCMSTVEKVAYGGLPGQLTEPVNVVAATANMEASKANTLIGGLVGPNSVSENLLAFQNYNRTVNAAIQDPWYAYSLIRGLTEN